jgi:hypothetical protein
MKKLLYIILVLLAAFLIITFIRNSKGDKISVLNGGAEEICFASDDYDGSNGYALALNVKNLEVYGNLNFLPEEKDSKIGPFEGIVSDSVPGSNLRAIAVWWDTFGEGMYVTEQLAMLWDGDSISVGFGEMVPDEQGRYVYRNVDDIFYTLTLEKISCEQFVEI